MSRSIRYFLDRYFLDIPLVVGLTAPAMLLASFMIQGFDISYLALSLSFMVFFSIYLFNRISDIEEDLISKERRGKFFKKYFKLFLGLAVSMQVISILLGFMISFWTGIIVIMPLLLSLMYSYGPSRLKEYFLVKNIVIGSAWAILIAFLPLAWFENLSILEPLLVFGFIFLKVGSDSILADVKDIKADLEQGTKTIPQKLGIGGTRTFLYAINTIAYLFVFLGVFLNLMPKAFAIFALPYLYSIIITYLIGKVNPRRHADIYADMEFFLIGLFAYLAVLIQHISL